MRIGHQLYNYLYDYTDDGIVVTSPVINCTPNGSSNTYSITGCHINWKEDQVYISVAKSNTEEPVQHTINSFINWMGGSRIPQSYKPLYELRDRLQKLGVEVRKRWRAQKKLNLTQYSLTCQIQ